jgi:hypothetical protein
MTINLFIKIAQAIISYDFQDNFYNNHNYIFDTLENHYMNISRKLN